MRNAQRFKFGPLLGLTILSLLGFMFFTTGLVLTWVYVDYVDCYMRNHYNRKLSDLIAFLISAAIITVAFLITFFQLLLSKARSLKVVVPIVVVSSIAFTILIALDFYLEIQLAHLTPKEALTKTEPEGKKGKSRFKMGYLIIYVSLCIVAGFIYLSIKSLEEYLENQKNEREKQEIVISHIF